MPVCSAVAKKRITFSQIKRIIIAKNTFVTVKCIFYESNETIASFPVFFLTMIKKKWKWKSYLHQHLLQSNIFFLNKIWYEGFFIISCRIFFGSLIDIVNNVVIVCIHPCVNSNYPLEMLTNITDDQPCCIYYLTSMTWLSYISMNNVNN